MKRLIPYVLVFGIFLSCTKEEIYEPISKLDSDLEDLLLKQSNNRGKKFFMLPSSEDFNAIPQDPKNPITKEKVILGKLLFHESAISLQAKDKSALKTYSCASCHHAKAGFQSSKRQGIGDGGVGFGLKGELRTISPNYTNETVDVQPIKTPTVLNSAYQKLMLWNGQFGATDKNIGTESQWTKGTPKETNSLGFEGVEVQAIAGISVHRLEVDKDLIFQLGYKEYFDKAFASVPASKRYTKINAGLAIAAYERTILANQAPFQKWLQGNYKAMSDNEKKGAILFFGKAKCYECHSGPALNSMRFSALGMNDLTGADILGKEVDDMTKKGRGGFTRKPEDDYKFKVPQLYSVTYNSFYGHGSSFTSIEDIIRYKNKAVKENGNVPNHLLDSKFKPLLLKDNEIQLLVDFLEKGLKDDNLIRYQPESVLSNNCIPNNDIRSKKEICGN